MNQRYVNPHPQMQPQMQVPQQMQQPQMQPQIIMTPQGPAMMTPQGLVLVNIQQMQGQPQMMPGVQMPMQFPQQGGMMQQHGGMMGGGMVMAPSMPMQGQQQQFPQQQQSAVVTNRFGAPAAAIMSSTTQVTDSGSNRYQSFQSPQQAQQQMQEQNQQVEEPTRPPLFIVTPTTHKFTGNEKFKMGVITEAIKPINVAFEEGYVAFTCLEEAVEGVIEFAYSTDDVRAVTVRNVIVNNIFYKVELRELITNLLAKDTKNLYKVFKAAYTKTTDKHQINVLNTLNTILTDLINDYMTVNSVAMITIDSFYTDYNDLLKVVNSTEEELEESLVEYLDKIVNDMQVALTNTPAMDKTTQITEPVSVAYLDKLVQETGLDVLGQGFVQLDDSIANNFLKSIAAEVVGKINKQEFLMVTLDKSVFKVMIANSAAVYVKKIA